MHDYASGPRWTGQEHGKHLCQGGEEAAPDCYECLDRLYFSIYGTTVRPDKPSWREEFVRSNRPYALERMLTYVQDGTADQQEIWGWREHLLTDLGAGPVPARPALRPERSPWFRENSLLLLMTLNAAIVIFGVVKNGQPYWGSLLIHVFLCLLWGHRVHRRVNGQ